MNLPLISFIADLIEEIFKLSPTVKGYSRLEVNSQDFINHMGRCGFKNIGSGAYRTVFTHVLTPEVVYKFGQSTSNFNELNIYNHVDEACKKHLATLHYTNGIVNVMERVSETVGGQYRKENINPYVELSSNEWPNREALRGITNSGVHIHDDHLENFGYTGDPERSVVMIDYGADHYFTDEREFPYSPTTAKEQLGQSRMTRIAIFERIYQRGSYPPDSYVSQVEPNDFILGMVESQSPELCYYLMNLKDIPKPRKESQPVFVGAYFEVPNEWEVGGIQVGKGIAIEAKEVRVEDDFYGAFWAEEAIIPYQRKEDQLLFFPDKHIDGKELLDAAANVAHKARDKL